MYENIRTKKCVVSKRLDQRSMDVVLNSIVEGLNENRISSLFLLMFGSPALTQTEINLAINRTAKASMRNRDPESLNSPHSSAVLKAQSIFELSDKGTFLAKKRRISKKIENWVEKALLEGCSVEQAQNVASCLTEMQLSQIQTGGIINVDTLIAQLIDGIKGKPILVRALNCLPHVHTPDSGDRINSSPRFSTVTANGDEIRVDKIEEIRRITNLLDIPRKYGINTHLELILMDIDPFIQPYDTLSKDVDEYRDVLRGEIEDNNLRIIKESELLGLSNPNEIWSIGFVDQFLQQADNVVGSIRFAQIYETVKKGILKKNISEKYKSEDHILETTKKLIFLEYYMGAFLSCGDGEVVPHCDIFIERANVKKAADTFILGASSIGIHPSVLFYWNEQVISKNLN